jgi:hypothetical protein
VSLPAAATSPSAVTGTVPAGHQRTLLNSATVTPPPGTTDPVPGDNTGTDTNPVGPQPTSPSPSRARRQPYVPGAAFTYTSGW